MVVGRLVAVSLLVRSLVLTVGENLVCGGDECSSEEMSLLSLRASKDVRRHEQPEDEQPEEQNEAEPEQPEEAQPEEQNEGESEQPEEQNEGEPFWMSWKGYSNCRNREGQEFPCGSTGKCCGDVCANENDVCCQNTLGSDFACGGAGGGCCGNACFAPGSKCCRPPGRPKSEWYPVSQETQCAHESTSPVAPHTECKNRNGDTFWCAENDKCCGDICVAAGGVCCTNANMNNFVCGSASSCCGNACAGSGSKCCRPQGRPKREWYPVSQGTQCLA